MSSRTRDVAAPPLPCTGSRLRKLTRRMTSFYELHLRQTGLKLSQYAVLMHLSSEAQTLLQLADRLEMDRTTLTRSLKPLMDQGWVAQADGDDARQRLLVLTTAGRRVRKQAQQVWVDAQLALENQLGRDFVANLNAQLDRALLQLRLSAAETGK
ncbi:MAG: winged helix-turn-helix transcriptional regulator [Burkholderiales bacterium]|nr:winged helix-turn-helix transcriptional regulator [Burkholderiales bacterium]